MLNGQLREFRLVHPESNKDITFAIELDGQSFFPIQDFRGNICALQKQDGTLAEWYRYSAFGSKIVAGNYQGICNPWRFANRREVANLSLFAHRFYNPRLMRWQTTDPLGFKDGLNLYAYTHNNPFYYKDPDGQFALALPFPIVFTVFQAAFGATATVTFLPFVGASLGVAAIGYGCYQLAVYASNQIDAENVVDTAQEEQKQTSSQSGKKKPSKVYAPDRPLPLDDKHQRPIPDASASGPHTQLGTKSGRYEKYPQAREFDKDNQPVRDIDFTDHGYPQNHPNPHQHSWIENKTGGTPKRGDAEPLNG